MCPLRSIEWRRQRISHRTCSSKCFRTFDESKASISTWIYTITHNTVINYYKSMKFRQVVDIPENYSEEVTEDFVEGLVEREMQGRLADALCKLDEDKRDLIILHYYSGHTLKEISELMKKPYGQIKRLHAKALGELSGMFEIK